MSKVKILIAIILLLGVLFFLQKQFKGQNQYEVETRAMKKSIIADPLINAPNLSEEQKAKFLEKFEVGRAQVIAEDFDILQGVNQVAVAKQLLGDLEGARIAWEYANIIRPNNSLSFSNLAALYHYDLKQYEKAETNYLISIANDPDDINTIRNLFELYYYSLKDRDRAEGLLLKSIEENPQAPDLYALAGSFYAETGDNKKAITFYQKALELNPNNEAIRKEIDRLKSE